MAPTKYYYLYSHLRHDTTSSILPISHMVEKLHSFHSVLRSFLLPRNIVDRVRLRPGSVSDFIDFFYKVIYIPRYSHDLIGNYPVIIARRSPSKNNGIFGIRSIKSRLLHFFDFLAPFFLDSGDASLREVFQNRNSTSEKFEADFFFLQRLIKAQTINLCYIFNFLYISAWLSTNVAGGCKKAPESACGRHIFWYLRQMWKVGRRDVLISRLIKDVGYIYIYQQEVGFPNKKG